MQDFDFAVFTADDYRATLDAVMRGPLTEGTVEWQQTLIRAAGTMQTRDGVVYRICGMDFDSRVRLLTAVSQLMETVQPETLSPTELVGISEIAATLLWSVGEVREAATWAQTAALIGSQLARHLLMAMTAGGFFPDFARAMLDGTTEEEVLSAT